MDISSKASIKMLKLYNKKYLIYSKKGQKNLLIVDIINRFMACINDKSKIKEAIVKLEGQRVLKTMDEIKSYAINEARVNIAYYNITYHCNLRCKYCYAEDFEKSSVSLADNEKILISLKKLGIKSLTLIGGEPFCHPYLLEILKSAVKKNFSEIVIVTNGTILPDKILAFCLKNKIKIQVSLDGITEKINSLTRREGSFSKVFSNLQKLKELGISFKVMQTITRENIGYAFSFYEYFKKRNISAGFFIVKDNASNIVRKPYWQQVKNLLDKLFAEEKDIFKVFKIIKIADNMLFGIPGFPVIHCGAGINNISISPRGDVYPCVKLCVEKFNMGSLLRKYPEKLFLPAKNISKILPFVDEIPGCQKCLIKFLCGGGCRAERYNLKKSFSTSSTSACIYYKLLLYFFDKILYRYATTN